MPFTEDVNHLQIPLQDISLATNGFANENVIGNGGFGKVYYGISEKHGPIAIKRLDRRHGQGDHEFKTEIALLPKYKHENIVSLLGFCNEDGEKILVYPYESNWSLDKHISKEYLKWIHRLQICLDAARGLMYVHDNVGSQLEIFHRDVKSSNILLDENWKAKISDFGLARIRPANAETSFLISDPCGTPGYIDPRYHINKYLTQKSDVYSFGVVLFEVLCGTLTCDPWFNDHLAAVVEKHYKRQTLDNIIPSYLRTQMNLNSLQSFSNIAYQCLKNVEERPTMKEVVNHLQEAIDHQLETEMLEEEGNSATEDERNGEDLEDPPLPPQQENVLNITFCCYCKGHIKQVRKCIELLEEVESVAKGPESLQVVFKGPFLAANQLVEYVYEKTRKRITIMNGDPT
ncbi:putative receptor-like protein kinase At5g39000 [Bidens hawaiensis]|uniref:putative receptor-like protein kinase At5g39000 n=1 Tax=Bidens hawaiensis TaxID=980011 RepID=UPI0040496C95